jgi:hypothetical protein
MWSAARQSRPLAFGFWLLAFGFWLLAFGFWLLAFGLWLLFLGSWLLVFLFCHSEAKPRNPYPTI